MFCTYWYAAYQRKDVLFYFVFNLQWPVRFLLAIQLFPRRYKSQLLDIYWLGRSTPSARDAAGAHWHIIARRGRLPFLLLLYLRRASIEAWNQSRISRVTCLTSWDGLVSCCPAAVIFDPTRVRVTTRRGLDSFSWSKSFAKKMFKLKLMSPSILFCSYSWKSRFYVQRFTNVYDSQWGSNGILSVV
jgi:hypothetical protein